jgi:hypothetical protein
VSDKSRPLRGSRPSVCLTCAREGTRILLAFEVRITISDRWHSGMMPLWHCSTRARARHNGVARGDVAGTMGSHATRQATEHPGGPERDRTEMRASSTADVSVAPELHNYAAYDYAVVVAVPSPTGTGRGQAAARDTSMVGGTRCGCTALKSPHHPVKSECERCQARRIWPML